MKIKKTDTYGKISLLVGLLSFSTLSSCVNTGQVLGMGGQSSRIDSEERKQLAKDLKRIETLEKKNRATLKRYGLAVSKRSPWYQRVFCLGRPK